MSLVAGCRQVMSEEGREFAELLGRYERPLLRYIMTFVSHRNDAEEILQQTVTILWEKFASYDRSREFLPWARGVAYFEMLAFRRENARSRLVFGEDLLLVLAATYDEQDAYLETQHVALRECLRQVGANSAALLVRRYGDDATVEALADEFGMTAKSVYRRLDRLRHQIGECVERRMRNAFR